MISRSRPSALAAIPLALAYPREQRLWRAPILAEIDSTAARCEGWSPRHSATMRMARLRTSGENFTDFFMALSSQELEPPPNLGRFRLGLVAA